HCNLCDRLCHRTSPDCRSAKKRPQNTCQPCHPFFQAIPPFALLKYDNFCFLLPQAVSLPAHISALLCQNSWFPKVPSAHTDRTHPHPLDFSPKAPHSSPPPDHMPPAFPGYRRCFAEASSPAAASNHPPLRPHTISGRCAAHSHPSPSSLSNNRPGPATAAG